MSDLKEKFNEFTGLTYSEQAKAFLNAYWFEIEGEAENIWVWTHQFIELDFENGKEGRDLDEFNAHRFLEKNGETRSVRELRDELRAIDMDFNKRMAVVEYLLFKYGKTVQDFVKRPQGGNAEGLAEAQRQLEVAQEALNKSVASYELAASEAKAAAQAEAELKAALDELNAQEQAFNDQKEELRRKSEEGGVVQRNKAKNELAQMEATDPLPLRQAKLNTEAATRKAERARAAADASADAAAQDLAAAEQAFRDAEEFMEELKANSGSGGQGALWWIDRELAEAKKFMPRGGMRHNF